MLLECVSIGELKSIALNNTDDSKGKQQQMSLNSHIPTTSKFLVASLKNKPRKTVLNMTHDIVLHNI